jgi:hypothetical protein
MVMTYLNPAHTAPSQCTEASDYFGSGLNCCSTPTPKDCVNGGWPQFDRYGFTFQKTELLSPSSALSWEDLKKQIDNNKPIAFAWHRKSGGGHMMVVVGYQVVDNVNYVVINDPWPPGEGAQYRIPYQSFVAPDAAMEHWVDYYDIAVKPPGGDMPRQTLSTQDQALSREAAERFRPTALRIAGRDTPGAVEASHLDAPLPAVELGLDALTHEAPGGDSEALLDQEARAVHYPVTLQGELVAAIATRKQEAGGWNATPENPVRLEKLTKMRQSRSDIPPDRFFMIDARDSVGLEFLAARQGEQTLLFPVRDDLDLDLRAGVPLDSARALRLLRTLARQSNGAPA